MRLTQSPLGAPQVFPSLDGLELGFLLSSSSVPSRGRQLISLDTNDGLRVNCAQLSNFIFFHC